MRTGSRGQRSENKGQKSVWATLIVATFLAFAGTSKAQLVVNYGFTPNTNIPDNGNQYTTTHTLGGFATYTDINVNLNLTTFDANDPMWLGDLYSSLTLGQPSETPRSAVLLNRPGRNTSNHPGSSLGSFNVNLDDAAGTNVFDATGDGTFQSDGRGGVDPYGGAVNGGTRNATLTDLNGAAFASNHFTLLIADTEQGGRARLSSWGMTVSGTAAASGTMSGDGGTFTISDVNSSSTNNIGAAIVTTQAGGGPLTTTVAGAMTFSGNVTGTSGLTKEGGGTLTMSANSNTYSGNTIVNGGTLLVTNTSGSGTGSGTVTVNNSGSVFGGSGSISGAVTVNGNARLQGGDGTTGTTLTLGGALTMADNSIIQLALGASGVHSTLARTGSGTWTFDADQAFNFLDLGAQATTYDNIITGLAADPTTEASWIIANAGWSGTFTYDGSGNIDLLLSVVAVPEPSTFVVGLIALCAMGYSQRRRFTRKS